MTNEARQSLISTLSEEEVQKALQSSLRRARSVTTNPQDAEDGAQDGITHSLHTIDRVHSEKLLNTPENAPKTPLTTS